MTVTNKTGLHKKSQGLQLLLEHQAANSPFHKEFIKSFPQVGPIKYKKSAKSSKKKKKNTKQDRVHQNTTPETQGHAHPSQECTNLSRHTSRCSTRRRKYPRNTERVKQASRNVTYIPSSTIRHKATRLRRGHGLRRASETILRVEPSGQTETCEAGALI